MTTKAYLIRCSTGCSCCRAENELRGCWRTPEAALEQALHYESWPLLSSQYAPRGRYEVIEVEAEVLPDGRLILENRLIAPGFADGIEPGLEHDPLLSGEAIDILRGTVLKDYSIAA